MRYIRLLPTTDHRPPTTDHRPPTTDYRPPTTDSEFPSNRELRRPRRLDVLQTAVIRAVDLIPVRYQLLRCAAVREIEEIRDHLKRRSFAQSELTSHPEVPCDQPWSPQLPFAARRIVEAGRCRQWIRDQTAVDRKRGRRQPDRLSRFWISVQSLYRGSAPPGGSGFHRRRRSPESNPFSVSCPCSRPTERSR
jgi:hypothetical protein